MFVRDQAERAELAAAADRCVRCALCLPHCPTYRIRKDEGDSPRGRIALIQSLATGDFEPSPALKAHLAGCLECRACEAACPSLVAFGPLMDGARALINQRSGGVARRLKRARLRILSSRKGARAAGALSKAYRLSGLGHLVEARHLPVGSRLRAYHRVAMQLDRPRPTPQGQSNRHGSTQELGLFLGCIAQAAQPRLAEAACRVLTRLGHSVRIPNDQRCCGAMHRHNGFPVEADRLLASNADSFSQLLALVTASACAAELRTHPAFSDSMEICRFLADIEWPQEAQLRPLRARAAVHLPCSHRNVLRDVDAACDLLQRIPQIELLPLEENAFCCGAAGTYLLESLSLSAALLASKISHLQRAEADFLVTTNTGCALHLAAGAREAGLSLEVLHPVELIERQLMA